MLRDCSHDSSSKQPASGVRNNRDASNVSRLGTLNITSLHHDDGFAKNRLFQRIRSKSWIAQSALSRCLRQIYAAGLRAGDCRGLILSGL
jgi:hypothetical protein